MKKKLLLFSLTTLLLLCFSACKAEKPVETELQRIVFTEPARVYHWAPAYLAQSLGYFEEAGLDAEFQTVSGADASAPVFAGDAQFGLRGVEMALIATEADMDCKIIVSTTGRMPYQLIGANESYQSVEDLMGQTIGGGRGPSSAPQTFARAIINQAGLTPDEDVKVVDMFSASYLAAIEAGEIQAGVATNPWAKKMLLDNGGVIIVDGADDDAMTELMGSSTYELFMIFATDEFIEAEPETVQKAVTAIARATRWMEESPASEVASKLEPFFEGRYDEMLYCVEQDKAYGLLSTDGYHTEAGFAAAINITKQAGGISTDIPATDIYDESFLDNAWAEIDAN